MALHLYEKDDPFYLDPEPYSKVVTDIGGTLIDTRWEFAGMIWDGAVSAIIELAQRFGPLAVIEHYRRLKNSCGVDVDFANNPDLANLDRLVEVSSLRDIHLYRDFALRNAGS